MIVVKSDKLRKNFLIIDSFGASSNLFNPCFFRRSSTSCEDNPVSGSASVTFFTSSIVCLYSSILFLLQNLRTKKGTYFTITSFIYYNTLFLITSNKGLIDYLLRKHKIQSAYICKRCQKMLLYSCKEGGYHQINRRISR